MKRGSGNGTPGHESSQWRIQLFLFGSTPLACGEKRQARFFLEIFMKALHVFNVTFEA